MKAAQKKKYIAPIIVMMLMVLFERFKEIKKGEDDDLSKY